MNYTIEKLDSSDESRYEEWSQFVNSHRELSIFHTIEWKRLLEKVFGYSSEYYYVTNQESKIVGISPAFKCKTFSGKIIMSMPFFEYGGPFVEQGYESAYKDIFELYKKKVESKEVKMVKIRSLPTMLDYSKFGVEGYAKQAEASDFILDLKGKDFEKDIWNGYAKESDVRTNIRKAIKKGAKLNKLHNWELLYKLVFEKDNKLGSPAFPKKYFEKLEEIFKDKLVYCSSFLPKEDVQLSISVPEKENIVINDTKNLVPVASIVGITFNNRMLLHQLGSDERHLRTCSTFILFNEMIKDALKMNLELVDFGRSKQESQHSHLKEQFLTQKRDAYCYVYPITKAQDHYKYLWVEKIFAKMPWIINKTPLGQFIIKRNPQ